MKYEKIIKLFDEFDKTIEDAKQNLNLYKFLENDESLEISQNLFLKANEILEEIKKESEKLYE